ncbi:hypothetical protein ACWCPQ_33630 [Nocardia sp. NPDC001965]
MADLHAYLDESGRQGKNKFMICAATVTSAGTAKMKTEIQKLRPPGSRRIHMKSVEKKLQLSIIRGVAALDAHSHLFVVTKPCSTRVARDLALGEAFMAMRELGVSRAVIESCDQDKEDRRVIHGVLGADSPLNYHHEPAGATNPLLWIPDVHAWAWGRGGTAREAVEHRITVQYLT